MRRCLIGDIMEAAAVVAAFPPDERHALAARLVSQTDAAHRYFKKFGRLHPYWGNGSLMSWALLQTVRHRAATPSFFNALAILASVLEHRSHRRQLRQIG